MYGTDQGVKGALRFIAIVMLLVGAGIGGFIVWLI